MSNIVILGGAAQMAQPAIRYLVEKNDIKEIIIADLNFASVEKIANELGGKIVAKKVDVLDKSALIELIKNTDLVMNFIGPYYQFGMPILSTVIEAGVNYIDICDDHDTTLDFLSLHDKAKEKGITALIGMGASPGVTNVMARLAADQFDQVEEINTYWVVGKSEPGGVGAMVHMFHIIDSKIPIFLDNELQYVEPFLNSTSKQVNFGGPVGEVTLYRVGHPEPVTLSKFIPGVKTVTNYGALLPAHVNQLYKTFVDFGLTSEEEIDLNGGKVVPLDLLLALFKKKLDNHPEEFSVGDRPLGASRVEVIGTIKGEKAKYTLTRSGHYTMANSTSLPTGIAAHLMLNGEIDIKGVIPPEVIDPKKILIPLNDTEFFGDGRSFHLEQIIGERSTKGELFSSDLFN